MTWDRHPGRERGVGLGLPEGQRGRDHASPDVQLVVLRLINRLFKCVCRFLSERVNYLEAARLLVDCEALLSEVEDVSPATALRDVWNLRFDRSVERFRVAFDLGRRLLAGVGHNLGVGSANTFVFLLDMNQVFEDYVHAVLESYFNTAVEEQKYIGKLLAGKGGIFQWADYYWCDGPPFGSVMQNTNIWQKASNGHCILVSWRRMRMVWTSRTSWQAEYSTLNDVRQLTVYAELVRRRERLATPPSLMLLYPFVGPPSECIADSVAAWNGSKFWLMPVHGTSPGYRRQRNSISRPRISCSIPEVAGKLRTKLCSKPLLSSGRGGKTDDICLVWAEVAVKSGKKRGHVKDTITMTKGVSGRLNGPSVPPDFAPKQIKDRFGRLSSDMNLFCSVNRERGHQIRVSSDRLDLVVAVAGFGVHLGVHVVSTEAQN